MKLSFIRIIVFTIIIILAGCKINTEKFNYDTIITVNPSLNLGTFDLKIGVNCGPYDLNRQKNNSSVLRDLGVKIIRTHDYYGPCDWYTIFPDWGKNENDPDSYNFTSSDRVIGDIIDNGFEILFRLGPSWLDENHPYNNDPPGTIRNNQGIIIHSANQEDFEKFATICANIQKHYNNGWDDGFHYNIQRWEIWNEPSLSEHFWTGTPEQFYLMYKIIYRKLKFRNKYYIVGGPGIAGQNKDAYDDGLLNYLSQSQIFPSFFSWHHYGSGNDEFGNPIQSPEIVRKKAIHINNLLQKYSFNSTNSICTEWNSGINQNNFTDSGKGAAYFAGVLKVFLDSKISESYVYRADDHPLGIFDKKGYLKIGGYSLAAWNKFTSNSHRVYCDERDDEGLYILSSRDDDLNEIRILVSNYSDSDNNIRFSIINLTGGESKQWEFTIDEIDDSHLLDRTVESSVSIKSSSITIDTICKSYSVQYIRVFN